MARRDDPDPRPPRTSPPAGGVHGGVHGTHGGAHVAVTPPGALSIQAARMLLVVGLLIVVAAPFLAVALWRVPRREMLPTTVLEAVIALGTAAIAWRRMRRHVSTLRRAPYAAAAWTVAGGVALLWSGVAADYGALAFDWGMLLLVLAVLGERGARHG